VSNEDRQGAGRADGRHLSDRERPCDASRSQAVYSVPGIVNGSGSPRPATRPVRFRSRRAPGRRDREALPGWRVGDARLDIIWSCSLVLTYREHLILARRHVTS
jgi:hypothetical protein